MRNIAELCAASESRQELADLLCAIADGSGSAFRQFRHRTLAKVLATALAIVRDHHAAEEVAQDVYVRVWKQAAAFDGTRGGAIAWLSAITRNRSLDYLRHPRARTAHDTLDSVPEISDPSPSPHERLEFANGLSVVRSRLDRMTSAERSLLMAAIIEETPYRALARASNVPLPTLKSQVRRALIKLSQDPISEPLVSA